MDSADELLVHQSRLSSFGQDTSRLYERADGKKPWRAECVVLDEHKAAAKDLCMEFAARWQLTNLKLRDNHLEHIAYLQAALEQAGPGRKGALENRLRSALCAFDRVATFKPIAMPLMALPACNDFVSYVHGRAHGTRVPLRAKARREPFSAGSIRGAVCGARTIACPTAMHAHR